MRVELSGGKGAVAVLVERLERSGRRGKFGCGNRAVVISVQRRDHGWKRAFIRLALGFVPVTRRVQFLEGDFPVAVLVQLSEGFGGGFDFIG